MKVKKKSLENSLDLVGISAALICAAHCAILPLLLTISTLGSVTWLENAKLEWYFIGFSIAVAAGSLLWSFFQKHRRIQALWIAFLGISLIVDSHIGYGAGNHWLSAVGGVLLATAHALNWLLLQNKFQFSISHRHLFLLSALVVALLAYRFTQTGNHSLENREELLELVWKIK